MPTHDNKRETKQEGRQDQRQEGRQDVRQEGRQDQRQDRGANSNFPHYSSCLYCFGVLRKRDRDEIAAFAIRRSLYTLALPG